MESDFQDKALHDHLEFAALAEDLEKSPYWKVIQYAAQRIRTRAINKFMTTDPDDKTEIIQLQVIIRKYDPDHGLLGELMQIKNEGPLAFEELKERGYQFGEHFRE